MLAYMWDYGILPLVEEKQYISKIVSKMNDSLTT